MGQLSGHRLPLLWCDSSLRWNDHIKRDPDGPVTRVDLCCALAACHGLVVNSTPQKYTGEVHFSAFSCVWRFKKRFFVILFCSDFHLQDREVHVRLAERTRSWVGERCCRELPSMDPRGALVAYAHAKEGTCKSMQQSN